jgi:hypothetical protein
LVARPLLTHKSHYGNQGHFGALIPLQESGTPKPNVHVLINLLKVLYQQAKFMGIFLCK